MSSNTLPTTLSFTSNGGSFPPHGVITVHDHGPYVVVANWIFMCMMVLTVATRLGTRVKSFDQAGIDNILILVAAAVSVAQSLTVHLAVNNGLGRHEAALSTPSLNAYNKCVYAGQILSIFVLCLAKLSFILVFMGLTPDKRMLFALRTLASLIILWALAAAVALALQCEIPEQWKVTQGRCFDQVTSNPNARKWGLFFVKGALYYANGILNIITDLFILAFPVWIVWDLQMKARYKRAVILIFWVRIIVCITATIQLVSLSTYLTTADRTWNSVTPTIWAQAVTNLSIITANVPLLKPLLTSIQSSLIDSSMPKAASSYQLSTLISSSKYSKKPPNGARQSSTKTVEPGPRTFSHSNTPLRQNAVPPSIELDSFVGEASADRESGLIGIYV